MTNELIEGDLLPPTFNRVSEKVERGTPLYRLSVGEIILTLTKYDNTTYAMFSRASFFEESLYDISAMYQDDALYVLRLLIAAAFCEHCKLVVDPDLDVSFLDDETVTIEQFPRDISSVIPPAIHEEDLVQNEGDEGQASGVHYFILKEDINEIESYCFVELDVYIPSYCDDECDANVTLCVAPNLDGPSKNTMITARRKWYVDHYVADFTQLFSNSECETLSLLGDQLSKANMLSIAESLADKASEWWYMATIDALAKACPNLIDIAIDTECEYDDHGEYFTSLSTFVFSSLGATYEFRFDYEGFTTDEDLLDDEGHFGGDEFDKLTGILGEGFEKNGVFDLVEALGYQMMRKNRKTERVLPEQEGVATCA